MNELISLPKLLEQLRFDLLEAKAQGEGKDLRFLIDDAEIELQTTATQEEGGDIGIKLWVLSADAKDKVAQAQTQKLKLKLKVVDAQGNPQVPIGSQPTRRPD